MLLHSVLLAAAAVMPALAAPQSGSNPHEPSGAGLRRDVLPGPGTPPWGPSNPNPDQPDLRYCDGGATGDGGCEANGESTFCTADKKKNSQCVNGGELYCAA
ncbi:hypothetical protein E4U42_003662 [Claviceps africana]|uniref:Uncharacterized protein n=1 Tax=Claviceps africana TaxID=83212 RepID=A0A8K0J6V7_9HYPO|nr:hypothetical protein E4U42_003662 [Claviceps africana]